MTDTRLNDCLDRWPGKLPEYLRGAAVNNQFRSLNSIARICRQQYARDAGDHWKTPDETWADHRGDCEDIAILAGAMVHTVFPGMKIELVLCWEAVKIGRRGHAVLCVHGIDGPVYLDSLARVAYGEATFRRLYEEHSRLGWPA